MIEFIGYIVEASKFLLKYYEKNAKAKNLVLTIQEFIKLGAPQQARECCYELIRLRHKHPDIYFLLATAQYELKEYDNCLKAIQEAIEIQSSHVYWELKGDALKALDRHQEAINAYNQAIKLNPSPRAAKQKRDACQDARQLLFGRQGLASQSVPSFGTSSITRQLLFGGVSIQLKSENGVNYRELEKLLKAKEWRKADELTTELMRYHGLRYEDIKQFPCEDLRTINQLWVHYSNSKFGFSIQKKLWLECASEIGYDHEVWKKFAVKVGWYCYNSKTYTKPTDDYNFKTYTQFMNDSKNAQNALPASLPANVFFYGGFKVGDVLWVRNGALFSRKDL